MSHRRYLELAAGSAIDDLDLDERAALDQHLRACGACRRSAVDLHEVVAALGSASPRRAPPSELWDAILAAIREPAPLDTARRA